MADLPQLQNRIKRDPRSYRGDFIQQLRNWEAQLNIFQLQPTLSSKEFGRLTGT